MRGRPGCGASQSSPYRDGSGITAADQASFVGHLERYVPRRHEEYALGLLARIVKDQRWGHPEGTAAGLEGPLQGWVVPGRRDGWRVNQVATLRRGRRSISLAVLTDGNRGFGYGRATIRGVARILLREYHG